MRHFRNTDGDGVSRFGRCLEDLHRSRLPLQVFESTIPIIPFTPCRCSPAAACRLPVVRRYSSSEPKHPVTRAAWDLFRFVLTRRLWRERRNLSAENPRILCTPECFSGGMPVHLQLKGLSNVVGAD